MKEKNSKMVENPPKKESKMAKKERKESAKQERNEHKSKGKVGKVMEEMEEGKLHSGSKKGPVVTNKKQGIAIALSEARKASKPVKATTAKKGK